MAEAVARGSLAFLDEAQSLYSLLTDGAPAAGYHLRRGLALRDAASRKPILSSYTSEWRPAREVHADGRETDRTLNPYVLRQHLVGTYDVAWTAPSWTSLVIFDIDRPTITYAPGEALDPDRELAADSARDAMLASVWDAFGCDQTKQPVVLVTPGYGYHVYLPLCRGEGAQERTWPAAWIRERIEHRLNQRGLDLRPGRLELFPCGVRLRAPCGAGSALMVPMRPDVSDDLRLELVHARRVMRRVPGTDELKRTLVRAVVPMVQAFCQSMEATRRPLEEWLDEPASGWHAQWGPWGDRPAEVKQKKPVLGDLGEVRCPNIKKKYMGGKRSRGSSDLRGAGCVFG